MTVTKNLHVPVLVNEVCGFLTKDLQTGNSYRFFDGTLGGGGYTRFLAQKLNSARLSDFLITAGDLDKDALQNFKLDKHSSKIIKLEHGNFAKLIGEFDNHSLNGIMLDLGFSSNQLEDSGRGFSYMQLEDPLDLRYDTALGRPTLKDKLRRVQDPKMLTKIIFTFSGEKLSPKFAEVILAKQKSGQMNNVGDLSQAITDAIPAKLKKNKYSILSRVWQAFRIWVNDEMDSLERFLPIAIDKMAPGAKLAIVCFHSLEDKLVTKFMRQASKPIAIDDYGNKVQYFQLLTPKGITPSPDELEENVRSRSGILRVLQKTQTED